MSKNRLTAKTNHEQPPTRIEIGAGLFRLTFDASTIKPLPIISLKGGIRGLL